MIACLQGVLRHKSVEAAILDVHGVGYQVLIPLSTYYLLPDPGERVTLVTTMYVREDALRLYGFLTAAEQTLFELLMGVSSIGPRLALNMLSSLAPSDLQQAIASSDIARLQTIPGVGRKTAERVALELKEKVALLDIAGAERPTSEVTDDDQLVGDVLSALLNLGYKRGEAEKALRAVRTEQESTPTLEILLRDALRVLAQTR